MKAFLMHPDRDFDTRADPPQNAQDLIQDLELNTLFGAMAAGDAFLLDAASRGVLGSLDEPEAIRYRQQVLADCLREPALVREAYSIAVDAVVREKKIWGFYGTHPDSLLRRSVEALDLLMGQLKLLRRIADEHGESFRSPGFRRFLEMISRELDDGYLATVDDHLERLRFPDGVVMSAELGAGNLGDRYVLRRQDVLRRGWRSWLGLGEQGSYTYEVPARDESGLEMLRELSGRGIALAAGALAQSTDHILSFFRLLRSELGFYVGCLNLHDQLRQKGEPVCFPDPEPAGEPRLSALGLYDPCLSLRTDERVVGNDFNADGKALVVITGANRGGKSTSLRALGLAQLMTQCGMFAAAEAFATDVRRGLFTHFKREEDASLRAGKLDEELGRMSTLVDRATPHSLVLLNESFASTNEREGSEIAHQIVRALLDSGIKVIFVTHMFDVARTFYDAHSASALFLLAERTEDGERTFRLVEGAPQPTSHGEDIYVRVFGSGRDQAAEVPAVEAV